MWVLIGQCRDTPTAIPTERTTADKEVDGGAEWGPPSSAGDEQGSVLPEVFESMSGIAGDQEPG